MILDIDIFVTFLLNLQMYSYNYILKITNTIFGINKIV